MNLEELFNEHGFSQTDIARLLAVSTNTVNRWCRASSKPSMKFRRRISEVLSVEPRTINQAVKNTWADKS